MDQLGIEPKALWMQITRSTTELQAHAEDDASILDIYLLISGE